MKFDPEFETIIEPFRIHSIEPLVMTTPEQRRAAIEAAGYRPGEYYALLLFASTGMLFMVSGFSLLTIWISLELMALASYILAGYARFAHPYDFYSMRYIFTGAEKLKESTRKVYSERYGVRVFEGYGATETSPASRRSQNRRSAPATSPADATPCTTARSAISSSRNSRLSSMASGPPVGRTVAGSPVAWQAPARLVAPHTARGTAER